MAQQRPPIPNRRFCSGKLKLVSAKCRDAKILHRFQPSSSTQLIAPSPLHCKGDCSSALPCRQPECCRVDMRRCATLRSCCEACQADSHPVRQALAPVHSLQNILASTASTAQRSCPTSSQCNRTWQGLGWRITRASTSARWTSSSSPRRARSHGSSTSSRPRSPRTAPLRQ